jgi:DTW domain-containing protein YfiP
MTLVVPDGTWRQAGKMCRRLPWMAGLRRVALPEGPPTEYRLRAEVVAGGLATAEAIARALGILEGPAVQGEIERVLRLMVERTLLTRGSIGRHEVSGGVPNDIMAHIPARRRS